eukprot:CAMPEP_0119373110 /NCGR_PEP_ID=MMETSP1334-20130426/23638_1 /TAXON_ID=127549 /ORGANISM="Calcidiscus leptoporus, Strain RCC1130" /LENGTH=117 /DNA_ID=CAMNT_0007390775 /DNA_START=23 /DNA_END=376 /DNA_ORIENTATION=-
MTTATANQSMPRNWSAILSFRMREWIETPRDGEASRQPPRQRLSSSTTAQQFESPRRAQGETTEPADHTIENRPPPGHVWVDCFYYGFWVPEGMAPLPHDKLREGSQQGLASEGLSY